MLESQPAPPLPDPRQALLSGREPDMGVAPAPQPLPPPPDPGASWRMLTAFLLVLAALAGLWPLLAPSALPADAPEGDFSAARAAEHLERLTRAPRTIGSRAHRTSLLWLESRIEALGLKPNLTRETGVAQRAGQLLLAPVQNLWTLLPGTEGRHTLLLVTHLDTVPNSPGAGDAGAGVVSGLEVLRALKAGPPLRHNVLVLWTDGEEPGSLGARVFAGQLPQALSIGLVLNLEGRGNRGASALFETSANNLELIRAMAQGDPRPLGNSLIPQLYKRLPYDTDLTVFKALAIPGLNFAFGQGQPHYHTPLDTAQALSLNTLQHHGDHALSLLRHFGALEMPLRGGPEAVYFNLSPYLLVRYPVHWELPLLAFGALLWLGVMALGVQRRLVRIGYVLFSSVLLTFGAGLSALLLTVSWPLLCRARGTEVMQALQGDTWDSTGWAWAFSLLILALLALLFRLLARRMEPVEQLLGTLLVWLMAGFGLAQLLPTGSFPLVWPSLIALLGLGWHLKRREARVWLPEEVNPFAAGMSLEAELAPPEAYAPGLPTALSLGGVAAGLLLLPVGFTLFIMAGLQAPALLASWVSLFGAMLLPWARLVVGTRRWLLPLMLMVLGLGALGLASRQPAFSSSLPRPSSLFFLQDADSSRAWWVTLDRQDTPWTRQALQGAEALEDLRPLLPMLALPARRAAASPQPLSSAHLERLEDSSFDGLRTLKLRVSARGEPDWLWIQVDGGLHLRSLQVQAGELRQPVPVNLLPEHPAWIQVWSPGSEGIELTLETGVTELVRVVTLERSAGFPLDTRGVASLELPAGITLSPLDLNAATVVRSSFSF